DLAGEGEEQLGRCRKDLPVARGAVGQGVVGRRRDGGHGEERCGEQCEEDAVRQGPTGAATLEEVGCHGATVRTVIRCPAWTPAGTARWRSPPSRGWRTGARSSSAGCAARTTRRPPGRSSRRRGP